MRTQKRTQLLKEEILSELRTWELGGGMSKMKMWFGELKGQMKKEVREEIRRLSSKWRTESTWPGDVSLATMVALKGIPAQIWACDLESGGVQPQAETGGLTQEANRKCNVQEGVRLLWWKRGQKGVHFDWIEPEGQAGAEEQQATEEVGGGTPASACCSRCQPTGCATSRSCRSSPSSASSAFFVF